MTTDFTIEVLLNRQLTGDGRPAIFARWTDGLHYVEGDELESVWAGSPDVPLDSAEQVLDYAWAMFNRGSSDFVGDEVYPQRSLSVGDVVAVNGVRYSAEPVGWRLLDQVVS